MRQVDRYWRLGMAVSVALLVVAIIFIVWSAGPLWDTVQFDMTYGPDPELDGLALRLLGLIVFNGGAYLLGGWIIWTRARAAQKRHLSRIQALAGNPNAVPRANILTDVAQAPDLDASGGQFRLLWRMTAGGRRSARIGYAVLQLMFGALLILMLFIFLALFSQTHFSFGLDWRSAQEIGALALLVIVGAGIPIGLLIVVGAAFSNRDGHPYGVIATRNGLTSIAANGKSAFIPWSEARVLEVLSTSTSTNGSQKRFQLYGAQSSVEWLAASPSRWLAVVEPPDASLAEYERQHQLLLNLIAARTGLVPRTFSKEPRKADPSLLGEFSVEAFSHDQTGRELGCLGVVVVLVAGVAALIVFLPLSHSSLLNLVVASALLLAPVLGPLNALVTTLIRSLRRRPIPPSPPLIALPDGYDPTVFYALRERRPIAFRLRGIVLGLLLGVCVAPGLALLFPDAVSMWLGSDVRIGDGPAWWLALTLAVVGLLGLPIVVGQVRSSHHEICADASGLSELTFNEWRRQARWDAITDFYVRHEDGGRNLFLAKRKAEFPVLWSAGEHSRAAGDVIEGRRYVSRDEFAAVVAQRTGTALKTLTKTKKK